MMRALLFILTIVGAVSARLGARRELSFLILSQKTSYHTKLANRLQQNISAQSLFMHMDDRPNVFISYEYFEHPGAWAITPILPLVLHELNTFGGTQWLIIVDDHSFVDVQTLTTRLKSLDANQEQFLGYPLSDSHGASIIHHFAFFDNPSQFAYPLIRAGVAISNTLLKSLAKRVDSEQPSADFSIDASHELAMFIWRNGAGQPLTPAQEIFCNEWRSGCGVYSSQIAECGPSAALNETIFAVKTFSDFHGTRLPIIQRTWGQYVLHIRFYSDVQDKTVPTIAVNVPNTDTGHCDKSLSILKSILREIAINRTLANVKWIVLADDDTLLSVAQLSHFLGCFDRRYQEDIYLGERYGYHLFSHDGYNYITGGGGIVFSLPVALKLIEKCTCPTPSSPDDMIIGLCLQRQQIEAIHSSKFHQARHIDYAPQTIEAHSISFHKFWQINPIRFYAKWFANEDRAMYEQLFKLSTVYDQDQRKIACPNDTIENSNNKQHQQTHQQQQKQPQQKQQQQQQQQQQKQHIDL